MKKLIKIIILLFILYLIYQFVIIKFFMTSHEASYSVDNYIINEKYQDNVYNLSIEDKKKNKFYFQVSKDYNNQESIVKKVNSYTFDDVSCLDIETIKSNKVLPHCNYNGEEVTLEALKTLDISLYNTIKEEIKLEDEVSPNSVENGDITYYPEYLDNDILLLWTYKNVFYLSNNKAKTIDLFAKDHYENSYGIKVNNYYLLPNTDEVHDFTSMIVINLTNGSKSTWDLDTEISFDGYFLGVVGDNAYFFDKDSLKEYKFNPKKETVEVVGDKENNGLYYDGEFTSINIYDLKDEIKFKEKVLDNDIKEMYQDKELYHGSGVYYYLDNNGIYAVYEGFKDSKVLLVKKDEIKELLVEKDRLYYISSDSIYFYQDSLLEKKVLTRRELLFNSHNIFTVYGG